LGSAANRERQPSQQKYQVAPSASYRGAVGVGSTCMPQTGSIDVGTARF
jgi:hypothetical protein